MFAIAGVVALGAVIAYLEGAQLIKQKSKKELWTFSILLIFGIGLTIVKILRIDLPNPLEWFIAFYRPISKAILSLFV